METSTAQVEAHALRAGAVEIASGGRTRVVAEDPVVLGRTAWVSYTNGDEEAFAVDEEVTIQCHSGSPDTVDQEAARAG